MILKPSDRVRVVKPWSESPPRHRRDDPPRCQYRSNQHRTAHAVCCARTVTRDSIPVTDIVSTLLQYKSFREERTPSMYLLDLVKSGHIEIVSGGDDDRSD